MGDEHDSWLETLGVSGFNPSDATASVASGLGKVLSGAGDAIASGARAVGDVTMAGVDAAAGVGAVFAIGALGIAAGAAYTVGEDDTAKSLRATQDSVVDDGKRSFGDAGRDLGKAKDEVFGAGSVPPAPPVVKSEIAVPEED